MLNRVFNSIRQMSRRSTGFDSYLSSLQRHSVVGGPTFDEAKRDFKSTVHNETSGLIG